MVILSRAKADKIIYGSGIEQSDFEGDFIVGVHQRDDLEFEHHILVFDVGGGVAVGPEAVAAGGNRDFLTTGDRAFLIVRSENARAGQHREIGLRLQCLQIDTHVVADFSINPET